MKQQVKESRKLVVIGLDGATWDLIIPWAEEGKLPTFKKLLDKGTYGNLKSTIPPISEPAWPSLLTGKGPGKLGIFDFLERKADSYELSVATKWEEWNPIWKILNDAGKRICVMNVPTASVPYEKIKGVFITGDITSTKCPIAYPPEIEKRLTRENYQVYAPPIHLVGKDNYLKKVYQITKEKCDIALQLFKERNWDFFMFVLRYLDMIQHQFWKYMDETHPMHVPNTRYKEEILKYYQFIDKYLSAFLIHLPTDAILMLVSDHGHGPHFKDVDLNVWLKKNGFLKVEKTSSPRRKRRTIAGALIWLSSRLSRYQLQLLSWSRKLGLSTLYEGTIVKGIEAREWNIDWEETRAYGFRYGGIFINLKGREPRGTVKPEDYEKTREAILKKLKGLKDPETGSNVIEHVWKREDIYSGPRIDSLPDLVVQYAGESKYLSFTGGFVSGDNPIRPLSENSSSAQHTSRGIFLVYGSGIRQGNEISGSDIYDVVPTILHTMGVAVPTDIDGKVLRGAFESESRMAKQETRYKELKKREERKQVFSGEESEKIKERLRELGYL